MVPAATKRVRPSLGSRLCLGCGYDLANLIDTDIKACPECGDAIDWDEIARRSRRRMIWRPAVYQLATMGIAYLFFVSMCVAYVNLPYSVGNRIADAQDSIALVLPFLYSPVLAVGVLAAFLGVSARSSRPVSRSRPWVSWTITGLVTLFWLWVGVPILLTFF